MGFDYGANFADVISEENLSSFGDCGLLLKRLKESIGDSESYADYWEEFARATNYGDVLDDTQIPADKHKEICAVYCRLCDEFKKHTGLLLEVAYHDSDNAGSRNDDVDGVFWSVWGMYELSEAGKKMEQFVNRCFYVTGG